MAKIEKINKKEVIKKLMEFNQDYKNSSRYLKTFSKLELDQLILEMIGSLGNIREPYSTDEYNKE